MEPTSAPDRWPPPRAQQPDDMPGWPATIWRGVCGRCPRCGLAPIFDGYLRVHKTCTNCGAKLGDMPADDAPPYIAMLLILHVLGIFVVLFYKGVVHLNVPVAIILLILLALTCCGALRLAKGAVIGILLKIGTFSRSDVR
jgi:uncharacterized protein (DUF983 family)